MTTLSRQHHYRSAWRAWAHIGRYTFSAARQYGLRCSARFFETHTATHRRLRAARERGIERILGAAVARPIFRMAIRTHPVVLRRDVVLTLRTMDHDFTTYPRVVQPDDADQHRQYSQPEAEALPGEDIHGRKAGIELNRRRANITVPEYDQLHRGDQRGRCRASHHRGLAT